MKRLLTLGVAALSFVCVAPAAHAQPALAPLFTVPGVINTTGIATFFACTNIDPVVAVTIGVEIYQADGTLLNTASTTAIAVAPMSTVLFGTNTAAALAVDASLSPGLVLKGSAHIVATGKKITCSAFLADFVNNPPRSMTALTIVVKGKQRGD